MSRLSNRCGNLKQNKSGSEILFAAARVNFPVETYGVGEGVAEGSTVGLGVAVPDGVGVGETSVPGVGVGAPAE
jgi:hypothetical protein